MVELPIALEASPREAAQERRRAPEAPPRERACDRVALLAARLLRAPLAQVVLVDGGAVSVEGSSTGEPRPAAGTATLCVRAVLGRETLVVEDCRADPRLAGDPAAELAAGPGGIRFYAGALLRARDGRNLGALCVTDAAPRRLSRAERDLLEGLAALAADRVELRLARERAEAALAERAGAEAALRERQRQLLDAQRLARVGDWRWEIGSARVSVSPEIARMFGLRPTAATGEVTLVELWSRVHPEDRARFEALLAGGHAGGAARGAGEDGEHGGGIEFRVRPAASGGGDVVHVRAEARVVAGRGARGRVVAGICRDVTELKAHEARITHLALHDSLTGLPNRRLFQARLAELVARPPRRGEQAALVIVDLDHLKAVNDGYGHEAGDAVLCAAARRLLGHVRPGDTVARLGGDEFALIVANPPRPKALRTRLEGLVAALSLPVPFRGLPLPTGASVGAALFPAHARDPDALLRAADLALYRIKAAGRGGAALFGEVRGEAVAAAAAAADAA